MLPLLQSCETRQNGMYNLFRAKKRVAHKCASAFSCSAFSLHLCPCSQQYMTHSYPYTHTAKCATKCFSLCCTAHAGDPQPTYCIFSWEEAKGKKSPPPSTREKARQPQPLISGSLPLPSPSADPAVANHRTKENELPKAIFKSIFASGRSAQSNRADLAAAIWSKELVVERGGLWFFLLSFLFWRRR